MCDLCISHDIKIKLFQRALTQPLDELSKNRITAALRDIEASRPPCMDEEPKVIDIQMHRIIKALDALSHPELECLVREIEVEVGQDKVTSHDPNALDE